MSQRWSERMQIIDWFKEGLIPGLLYFKNGGEYTGSVNDYGSKTAKEFRYKLDAKESTILAMVWYGPCCFKLSEIAEQAEFSLDEEGRTEMLEWLKAKYESMIE